MEKGWTELVFILDCSGSMAGLEADTIGGFNAMIEQQKQQEGEARVSTVLFNQESTVLHNRVDLRKVEPMTGRQYTVGGGTALLDAVGTAIQHIGSIHKYACESERPAHTLFVITTDGEENSSRRYTREEVRRMIRRQKSRYGWEFLFLGANIDAVEAARGLGIDKNRATSYRSDSEGTRLNYSVISQTVCTVRRSEEIPGDWASPIAADFQGRR